MFALGTLQNELRQQMLKTTTYQSSCYKVKVITHTIVQTEYNNILRTPNSHTHTPKTSSMNTNVAKSSVRAHTRARTYVHTYTKLSRTLSLTLSVVKVIQEG